MRSREQLPPTGPDPAWRSPKPCISTPHQISFSFHWLPFTPADLICSPVGEKIASLEGGVLKFSFYGRDRGIILNLGWCLFTLPFHPVGFKLGAGTEHSTAPLRSEILQTMVTGEEVGQLKIMIGRPSSQMAYLFSSWRGFFK